MHGTESPYMKNHLLDGRLSISNNTAENTIRPFTAGRKNWLFADTPKEAYLLLYMPDVDWRNNPAQLDFLMPWSEAVQEECKR